MDKCFGGNAESKAKEVHFAKNLKALGDDAKRNPDYAENYTLRDDLLTPVHKWGEFNTFQPATYQPATYAENTPSSWKNNALSCLGGNARSMAREDVSREHMHHRQVQGTIYRNRDRYYKQDLGITKGVVATERFEPNTLDPAKYRESTGGYYDIPL